MTNTFIKRPELIEENYQTEDLLDFSSIIDDFKERINKINKNSVVGLIGPYGSGKSTMLYQIYKDQINTNDSSKEAKWLVFDAWQYPERKDLWEGFVLDIARQCNKKLFNYARNIIDGKSGQALKNLSTAAADTVNTFLPGASVLKNLIPLFHTSPARRVYEFQELLVDIINKKVKKDVFIIIEDIDRSGDMGVFFLETLKHFIKNREEDLNHKVIVIVPIGEEIWQEGGDKKIQDSYSKTLDLKITFLQEDIDFTNFITQVFDINRLCYNNSNYTEPDIVISHICYLFENMILKEQQTTVRDIKNILRKSESNFLRLQQNNEKKIDIRILILFTAIEYFYQREKNYKYTFTIKSIDYSDASDLLIANNFWGKELIPYIIYGTKLQNKEIIEDSTDIWVQGNDTDKWDINTGYSNNGNSIYRINSIYFSATGVKVTKS